MRLFMIRCIRLFTDDTGQSSFEEGCLRMEKSDTNDELSTLLSEANYVSFRQTKSGGSFDWHTAPTFQYVLTLKGTLEFATKKGDKFTIYPGDVLLAGDLTGGGHRWRLVDRQPWYRVYIALKDDAPI